MSLVADRREAIIAAVGAYNRAHPQSPLPRPATRLLTAMFACDDTCQQSLEALLDGSGVSRPTAQSVLRTLLAAGVVAKEEKGHRPARQPLSSPAGAGKRRGQPGGTGLHDAADRREVRGKWLHRRNKGFTATTPAAARPP